MSPTPSNNQSNTLPADGIPRDRQVYVIEMHHADEGGPRTCYCPAVSAMKRASKRYVDPWPRLINDATTTNVPIQISIEDPKFFVRNAPISDYTELTRNLMVFSRRAVDALHDMLAPCGFFVPLACDEAEFLGFCLDGEADVLDPETALNSNRRYAFHTQRLGAKQVFRAAGDYKLHVLQRFVETVRANAFCGFRFCRVWPAGSEPDWRRCLANWV